MLKATAFEFRFRFLIHAIIFILGFTAPWNSLLHLDTVRTWQFLAAWPTRSGWLSFSASTVVVLILGILCTLISAVLRTWGSSCLGASIVQDTQMHGQSVVAAGPYRYLRNPLYLAIIIHTLALSLLMVPSGAIFSIVLIFIFQLRLIATEEAFLAERLGEPYRAYCAKVPRLIPALTPRIPPSPAQPNWPVGFLGEIYMWGAFLSFAIFGWRYNSILITRGILVSLGISLIARAFIAKPQA
jgi:protein-S-isoprenylcysteine O-methyltransferase Ste14